MNIQKLFENYQAGTVYVDSDELAIITEYTQNHSVYCIEPLYRGINVDMDYEINIGDTVNFIAESFSEAYYVAKEFATNKAFGIIFVIEEGAEGFPLYEMTGNDNEYEWLVTGQYEVINIEEEDHPKDDFGWIKIVYLNKRSEVH